MHHRLLVLAALLGLPLTAHAAPLTPAQRAQDQQAAQAFANGQFGAALPLLTSLAAAGDPQAQDELGQMYFYGWGVPADQAAGVALLNQAVAQKYPDAEYNLAKFYYDGGAYEDSFPLYLAAAQQGLPVAQGKIGFMYFYGTGTPVNVPQAIFWLQKGAAAGDGLAENDLGNAYHEGAGVKQDYAHALALYEASFAAGHATAAQNAGDMYHDGLGVTQNYALAMQWYKKSWDAKNTGAALKIGIMYESGDGVAKDYDQAEYWYTLGADTGDVYAEYNLARLYRHGWGVIQNTPMAIYWYRQAADQGYAEAADILGDFYYFAEGVPQDYTLALHYYAQAADGGDTNAMVDLGYMNEIGQGVRQNYQTDLEWALVTKSLIHGPSIIGIHDLPLDINRTSLHISIDMQHLTQDQVLQARQVAQAWLQRHNMQYDPALDDYNVPAEPAYRILAGALFVILCAYAVAKYVQYRKLQV